LRKVRIADLFDARQYALSARNGLLAGGRGRDDFVVVAEA
jgi:hypothetical protein